MAKKLLICILLITSLSFVIAENPKRYSTQVEDATEAYDADEWIVSPDEEPEGDYSEVADCDIYGVISCYDKDYISFDIFLQAPISWEYVTIYAVQLQFKGYSEYYTYDTEQDILIYEKEKGGKIIETKYLTVEETGDSAEIIDSEEYGEDDICFILSKKAHIKGTKGKEMVIPCKFFAGYRDEEGNVYIDDDTITVDVAFVY